MAKAWGYTLAPDLVEKIYRQVLERDVDNEGLVFWGCQLSRGEQSIRQIVKSIGLSEEYAQKFITPFNFQMQVEFCYSHFLARASDPEGLQYWINVAQQKGMNAVISGFVDSQEYTNRFGDDGVPG